MLRVALVCIGRVKAGPERSLATRYIDRAATAGRAIGLAVEVRELGESRARHAEARMRDEAAAIRSHVGEDAALVALDEAGTVIDSAAFARLIGTTRDRGVPALAIAIGGADGLDPELRQSAQATLAFGAMTWPHQLVRIMAAEQIYRATTILAGHPYHRT